MRIIDNKRKDYYDGVQGMGQDRSLVYVRTPKKEYFHPEYKDSDLPRWPFPRLKNSWWHKYRLCVQDNVIGFCGKVYPAIRVWNQNNCSNCLFCFSIEDFDRAVEELGFSEEEVEMYNRSEWTKAAMRSSVRRGFPFRRDVERFFGPEVFGKHTNAHAKRFEEHFCPVFVATDGEGWGHGGKCIEYNAMLRPYDFMRVFDPYRAYQEISMYLGNMAFPNRPIPHVSDEDLAAAKGFDKFSFRKDKQK